MNRIYDLKFDFDRILRFLHITRGEPDPSPGRVVPDAEILRSRRGNGPGGSLHASPLDGPLPGGRKNEHLTPGGAPRNVALEAVREPREAAQIAACDEESGRPSWPARWHTAGKQRAVPRRGARPATPIPRGRREGYYNRRQS